MTSHTWEKHETAVGPKSNLYDLEPSCDITWDDDGMVAFSLSHVGGACPTHFAEGRTRDSLSGTWRASEPQVASVIVGTEGLADAARATRRAITNRQILVTSISYVNRSSLDFVDV